MYKLVLFGLLAVVCISAAGLSAEPEGAYRFLVATRTSTQVRFSTTTIPTVVKRTCWVKIGAALPELTMCRRRRGIPEEPEILNLEDINPSTVVPLDATVQPEGVEELVADILSEGTNSNTDLETSSEVEINGVAENCLLGRAAFGITIFQTTTTTVVITTKTTDTSGAVTFSLDVCVPSQVISSKC